MNKFVSITDRISRRAFSRAGAVAVVLATGPSRRVFTLTTRVGLLMIGSALIAGAVAVTLWTGLGPGPLDVFIGAIGKRTGLPLTIAVWATVGSMLGISWILGRRPGIGSVLSPLAIGPVLQGVLAILDTVATPDSLFVRLALQLLAVGVLGVGAGALIVSGLGAGSGELLARAVSDRSDHPERWIRTACEFTWIAAGVALGGPAGVGTVIVAATIGPSVIVGHRMVDSTVERSLRGLDAISGTVRPIAV